MPGSSRGLWGGVIWFVGGTAALFCHTVLFPEAFIESPWSPLHVLCALAAGFVGCWLWRQRQRALAGATVFLSLLSSWAVATAVPAAFGALSALILLVEWIAILAVLAWCALVLEPRTQREGPGKVRG